MKRSPLLFMAATVLVIAVIVLSASVYTIDEAEQAIIVQLGAPVGEPITTPGLHFKKPFVQEVHVVYRIRKVTC